MISNIHIALLIISIIAIFAYTNTIENFVPYYEKETKRWSTGASPLSFYPYRVYKKNYRHPFTFQTNYPYPYRTEYPYAAN